MKKQFLITIVLLGFISCQEDVRFNNPSLQGLKDNVFWRAVDSKASFTFGANDAPNGSFFIQAFVGNETVSFKLASTKPQTYILGGSSSNIATYSHTVADEVISYSTEFDSSGGQIVITEYDEINKTVTGTFKFKAENTDDSSSASLTVNFQQGVFYKIPVSSAVLIY